MKKKILSIIGWIMTGLLIICLLFTIFIRLSGKNVSIFGISMMYVVTGSMEPEISVGDCVIVKKVDVSTLQVGDDISYNGEVGDYNGKVITHRIINIYTDKNDEIKIRTKGVANLGADPEISASQVVGKVIAVSPFLGKIQSFFASQFGFILIIIPLVVIMVLEFMNVRKAVLGKDEDFEEDEESENADVKKKTESDKDDTDDIKKVD